MNAKELANQLINRVKNMQDFTVTRELEYIPCSGVIPFDITHKVGEAMCFTVSALSQVEAEKLVDAWINSDEE
jgi:hypothetical protein